MSSKSAKKAPAKKPAKQVEPISKEAKPNETKPKESKQTLDSTDIDQESLVILLDSELETTTPVGHHINSFDEFTSIGINQIVTKLFKVEKTIQNERTNTPEDTEIETISYVVKFDRVEIERPTTMFYKSGRTNLLMPGLARRHNLNYSAPIKVDATIIAKAYLKNSSEPRVRTEEVKDFRIAQMPIMVRSRLCNTHDMTAEALKDCEEDPRDMGGYFILKGQEWVVSNLETRLYNHPHIFRNVGHEKERTRLEFLSIPGDAYENSSELIIRFLESGQILFRFTSNIYLKILEIPFHVLFRLFGMTSDKEIIDNIVYGYSEVGKPDVMSDHMMQILKKAFQTTDNVFGEAKYITDQAKLLKYFAKQTSIMYTSGVITPDAKVDENTLSYLNTNILRLLDKNVFPHIGMSQDTRHKKLRYLGHLIHKLFLVEHEVVESTDRDSFKNKRVNAAGRGYAKAFKTQFNLAIVQQVSKKLRKSFKNMPFSQVPLAQSFKNSIYGPDLERALIQTIVTGTKELTLRNKQISNRLASEMLHRKNQLNTVSTLRTVRTPSTSSSKQDARADEMRRVHPSYAGFLCPIQSADTGEQVGMVKQMSISASISPSGIGHVLKTIMLKDPLVIPLARVFPEDIHKNMLTKVFVNGDWIGCTTNSPQLVFKYRDIRRGWDNTGTPKRLENTIINPRTSMYWNTDSNEVQFWVDAGRLVRPILVVRNNTNQDTVGQYLIGTKYDSLKDTGFVQDICLSKSDVEAMRLKKITIANLHERGIVDYICPEEMENMHIASDLRELHANRYNSLRRYTHCEIPISLLGLPALTCPYTNHNPAVRTTFQTNQVKQTCGWYALNWPYRVDKHAFLQYYCEMPLIKTISNKYVYPNGSNPIVAIASYGGHNQEDSLYLSKASAERGQFKGISFNFVKTELESHEKFGNPDEAHTMELKKHANYAKIEDGHVKPGTMLTKGDVAIGKYFQLPKPSDQYFYRDTSFVFNSDEDAMVETVIRARNEEDNEFCKMKMSSVRPLGIGDKFSSRSGQKGMTGMTISQADMMVTESGITPTLIMNPHGLPSRMTVNQLMEGQAAKVAALLGAIGDGTAFCKTDINAVGDKLVELGYDRHGTERMFNGMTGEWMDVDIFISPCYYQRLQKFAVEDVYSISTGPTCAITRQPLNSKIYNYINSLIFWRLKVHIKVCASVGFQDFYLQQVKVKKTGATFSNCGNTLRAFNTTLFWKQNTWNHRETCGHSKNLKDWAIRSERPTVLLPISVDNRNHKNAMVRVQRLQREWGAFSNRKSVLRYSLISCESMSCNTVEGKANKGGLRVGEMEKDVIISQGCGHFIMEKFRDDSDGFDVYVCRNCGKRPVVNEFLGVEICNVCRDDADIIKIATTWASKLFFQELESMCVGVRLGIKPFEYEQPM